VNRTKPAIISFNSRDLSFYLPDAGLVKVRITGIDGCLRSVTIDEDLHAGNQMIRIDHGNMMFFIA